MDPRAILTNKIGPLPAWAWGGIAGGGILGWRLWRARGAEDPAEGVETVEYVGTLDETRPDLLGGRDTAGWPPASGAPEPIAPPDWLGVPPDWYITPPDPLVVEVWRDAPALAQEPAQMTPPPAGATNPHLPTPAPGPRKVGPWSTKAARDRAVADVPAGRVRPFSAGGKFYAEIYPAPATAAAPAPSRARAISSPVGGGHPAPAPAPATKRTVGPWPTAKQRDAAVSSIPPGSVRKWSSGGKFYADVWS